MKKLRVIFLPFLTGAVFCALAVRSAGPTGVPAVRTIDNEIQKKELYVHPRTQPQPDPAKLVPLAPPRSNADAQSSGPLPEPPLPQGFRAFRDPQGTGRVLYGTFSGNARSATAVTQGILGSLRGYFDGVPEVQTAVRDDADHQVQAMFSVTIQRATVLGVAGVDLGPGGGSVSLLFDRPESFRSSFPRLRNVLAASMPQRPAEVPLQPMTLGDGSTISLPPGWRVMFVGKGSVDLEGPRGEAISLGAAAPVYRQLQPLPGMPANYVFQAPCCDPVRAFQVLFPQIAIGLQRAGKPPQQLIRIVEAQPTPWPNGQAAYVLSELNVGGRRTFLYSLLVAIGGFSDQWTFYTSGVSAPADVFPDEFSTMLRVWKSYSVNPAVFQERLDNAVKNMNESWRLLRAGMAEATRASLSASEGWDQVIRGVQTIEHTGSGRRWEADNRAAQDLVNGLNAGGSGHWRIVPPSELIPRQ